MQASPDHSRLQGFRRAGQATSRSGWGKGVAGGVRPGCQPPRLPQRPLRAAPMPNSACTGEGKGASLGSREALEVDLGAAVPLAALWAPRK